MKNINVDKKTFARNSFIIGVVWYILLPFSGKEGFIMSLGFGLLTMTYWYIGDNRAINWMRWRWGVFKKNVAKGYANQSMAQQEAYEDGTEQLKEIKKKLKNKRAKMKKDGN